MKSKKTKSLALLLSLVMTISVFALLMTACGTKNYNVTFSNNYDGSSAHAVVQVDDGKTVSKPETDPEREGYTFDGWFTSSAVTKIFDFTTVITADTIIYAGWSASTFTLTYNYNYTGSINTTEIVGNSISITRPSDPTRTGYRFAGWYTTSGGNTEFSFDDGITRNTTIYAKWESTTVRLTYNYNYDDAPENTLQNVEIDSLITKIADPTRDRYIFTGWYKEASNKNIFDFDTETISAPTTLYAGWAVSAVKITYDLNYEDAVNEYAEIALNETAPKKTPQRTGYDFDKWYTTVECVTEYNFDTPVNADITIYAGWSKKEYTITFMNNYSSTDTTTFTTSKVLYQDSATEPETEPSRLGYVFIGWYEEPAATNLFDFAASSITEGKTLYAGWTEETVTTITVNFKNNFSATDDSNYSSLTNIAVGAQVSVPATDPVRDGYYFAGWYTTASLTTRYINGSRVSTDTNIYARWLKKNVFEAEYTYMDGKISQGTSTNSEGAESIIRDSRDMANSSVFIASNNYYVTNLYYNGAYLEFEIYAESDITDAVLELRLTPEFYNMVFEWNDYQIVVNNGDPIKYDVLILTIDGYMWPADGGTQGSPEMNKRPFKDYLITTELKLNAGNNSIKLITNNERDHGATFEAETPAVDCIYIYTDTNIDWAEGKCYTRNLDHFN